MGQFSWLIEEPLTLITANNGIKETYLNWFGFIPFEFNKKSRFCFFSLSCMEKSKLISLAFYECFLVIYNKYCMIWKSDCCSCNHYNRLYPPLKEEEGVYWYFCWYFLQNSIEFYHSFLSYQMFIISDFYHIRFLSYQVFQVILASTVKLVAQWPVAYTNDLLFSKRGMTTTHHWNHSW